MQVVFHPDAARERDDLPGNERRAMGRAFDLLEEFGDRLTFPHQSHVVGAGGLRELRPRSGRSPWRAFYRRIGPFMVVGAIGPEAQVDPKGFRRAVARAARRLSELDAESMERGDTGG